MASLTYEKKSSVGRTLIPIIALIVLIAAIAIGPSFIGQAAPKASQATLSERVACYSQNCAVQFEKCLNNSTAAFSACQNNHQSNCFAAQQNADAACEQEFRQCVQNCKTASR